MRDGQHDGDDDGRDWHAKLVHGFLILQLIEVHKHACLEAELNETLEGQLTDSAHSSETCHLQLLHFKQELIRLVKCSIEAREVNDSAREEFDQANQGE